jgi:hypothetical protein
VLVFVVVITGAEVFPEVCFRVVEPVLRLHRDKLWGIYYTDR